MVSLRDIRKCYLEFFQGHGHEVLTSSSLVPNNDPTLLFTNAGMVQFKDYFIGVQKPSYNRAVTTQKCVRAGGKHNDLDNVGYTARHHTFFEMLGNFSFGDYFKAEAIELSWDLVTNVLGLDKDKLLVTIYHTDDEAYKLWKKIAGLTDNRIIKIKSSDNFWAMGDTGPCGPCSEIFYDHGPHIAGGPPGSPNEDGDRFIEIWNLVFMQFQRHSDGSQVVLPRPSIDTGMGLERTAAILQGKHDNYEIDLFSNLIKSSVELTGVKAIGEAKFSHRVIADHLRSSSFLMADGISPSNEGRGYVLRRIMRRAMRHAHILGSKEPLMHRLVPTLINEMGDAFNELNRAKLSIESTFLQEEERFLKTLGRGTTLLNSAIEGLSRGDILNGEMAFKLYDTYGFPVDLTEDALRTKGISVDLEGFDKAMLRQKENSKVSGFKSGDVDMDNIWFEIKDKCGPTEFVGYETLEIESVVDCILVNGAVANSARDCDIMFITKKSPFYAESGGQAGDIGVATLKNGNIKVSNVIKKAGDLHVVIGYLDGSMKCGDKINLSVDAVNRKQTTINHSAAHLMHEALRRTLGEHVTQKGQMVDGDKIRFDISHGKAISNEELLAVEKEVNDIILQNSASTIETMKPDEAIAQGAMALFGEKYEDSVRVLSIGDNSGEETGKYSVELCGGTHVEFTGDIALFKILSESAIAAGVRRLEAVTGHAAREYLENQAGYAVSVAKKLKSKPELIEDRVTTLINERNSLEKELIKVKKALALGGGGKEAVHTENIHGVNFLSAILNGISGKDLRSLVNEKLSSIDTGLICFIGTDNEKVALIVAITNDLLETYNAVELVNAGAEIIGGRGGGKPNMAQAGGSQASKAADALNAIKNKIK